MTILVCHLLAVSLVDKLVKKDGIVEYTITIRTGDKDVPESSSGDGNHLEIITDGHGNLTGTCTMSTTGDIPLGTSLALPTIPKHRDIVCKHFVRVTQLHQDLAKLPAFNISAFFTGPNMTNLEFHVPSATTQDVPVYTGGVLAQPTSRVLQSPGKYYNDAGLCP